MSVSFSLNNRSLGLEAPCGVISCAVLSRNCGVEEAAKAHISVKATIFFTLAGVNMCSAIYLRLNGLHKLLGLYHRRILLHFEHLVLLLFMSKFVYHIAVVEWNHVVVNLDDGCWLRRLRSRPWTILVHWILADHGLDDIKGWFSILRLLLMIHRVWRNHRIFLESIWIVELNARTEDDSISSLFV